MIPFQHPAITTASDNLRVAMAPPQADTIDARVLAPNTVEVHQIPANARAVVFSGTGDFYARIGSNGSVSAAVPGGDVLDGSAPELNPAARYLIDGQTHIALVASAACTVTLSFYGR